jgi:hypothetical protein
VDMPEAILGGPASSYRHSESSFLRNFRPYPSELIGLRLPKRLGIYDHAKHFAYRADWLTVGRLHTEAERARYIDRRLLGYNAAKAKWCLKQSLRPIFGEKARHRVKKLFSATAR